MRANRRPSARKARKKTNPANVQATITAKNQAIVFPPWRAGHSSPAVFRLRLRLDDLVADTTNIPRAIRLYYIFDETVAEAEGRGPESRGRAHIWWFALGEATLNPEIRVLPTVRSPIRRTPRTCRATDALIGKTRHSS